MRRNCPEQSSVLGSLQELCSCTELPPQHCISTCTPAASPRQCCASSALLPHCTKLAPWSLIRRVGLPPAHCPGGAASLGTCVKDFCPQGTWRSLQSSSSGTRAEHCHQSPAADAHQADLHSSPALHCAVQFLWAVPSLGGDEQCSALGVAAEAKPFCAEECQSCAAELSLSPQGKAQSGTSLSIFTPACLLCTLGAPN